MKIGDLIENYNAANEPTGIVIDFVPCTHAKQHPKVIVLTEHGLENWIIQFCEIVDEE